MLNLDPLYLLPLLLFAVIAVLGLVWKRERPWPRRGLATLATLALLAALWAVVAQDLVAVALALLAAAVALGFLSRSDGGGPAT